MKKQSCQSKVNHMSKNCGIYKITSPSGKVYIGQATNLYRRINRYSMSSTYKNQPKLRNSFEKYGFEAHQFDIIEYCSEEELNCSERFWQDEFDVIGENGLNCILQECGQARKVYTKELRKKISESKIGDKNPNWGKKMSQETIDKRNSNPYRKTTKGRVPSEETRQKMKDSHYDCSGGNNSRAKITICLKTGIFYYCLKDACETYGLNYKKTTEKVRNNKHEHLKYI